MRGAMPTLPDDGFTDRVLATLPTPEKAPMPWLRTAVCLVGAAAGYGFALWQGMSVSGLETGGARFATALVNACAVFADPLLGAAFVMTACSLLVAFWGELRQRYAR